MAHPSRSSQAHHGSLVIYTSSSLSSLARCPREHHYRYGMLLASPSGAAADFGTLVHRLLEHLYRTGDLDLAGVTDAKARALVIAYDVIWPKRETLEVEREFTYDLEGHTIAGKLDAVIRDEDGRVWIVEHKTTSRDADVGSVYWQRLTLDLQCSIYIDGARSLGYDPAGVIYDVLRVPRHSQLAASDPIKMTKGKRAADGSWLEEPKPYAGQRLRAETDEEFENRLLGVIAQGDYLLRSQVVRLEHELVPMRRDILEWITIARVRDALELYPRNPSACMRGAMMCSYFSACTGDAETLAIWPRKERAHVELAHETGTDGAR